MASVESGFPRFRTLIFSLGRFPMPLILKIKISEIDLDPTRHLSFGELFRSKSIDVYNNYKMYAMNMKCGKIINLLKKRKRRCFIARCNCEKRKNLGTD